MIGLDIVADRAGDAKLSLFAVVANLLFGYVSFLLVSYVCYSFVYGLVARTGVGCLQVHGGEAADVAALLPHAYGAVPVASLRSMSW